MITIGTFGNRYFGARFFGCVQVGMRILGTVTSASLTNRLQQVTENEQQIDPIVTIGGTDVSDQIVSAVVTVSDQRASGTCKLTFSGAIPAAVVEWATVEVSVRIRFDDGSEWSPSLFTGIVRRANGDTGASGVNSEVLVYDPVTVALDRPPANTTWTGTAIDLVRSEAANAGVPSAIVDFTDYDLVAADLTSYQTARELIAAVASGINGDSMWIDASGTLHVASTAHDPTGIWSLKLSACTRSSEESSASQRYKSLTVQGTTGQTAYYTGTGTIIGSESSAFLSEYIDLHARALAVVSRAEHPIRVVEMPLNPLSHVGEWVNADHTDGTTYAGRVSSIRHTLAWPGGCWTEVRFEVMA